MDGHAVSPLDLSRTLPVGGGLLVPYPLSGSPVIKQLMQIVTMVPGQGGQFQSVCFPQQKDFKVPGKFPTPQKRGKKRKKERKKTFFY